MCAKLIVCTPVSCALSFVYTTVCPSPLDSYTLYVYAHVINLFIAFTASRGQGPLKSTDDVIQRAQDIARAADQLDKLARSFTDEVKFSGHV